MESVDKSFESADCQTCSLFLRLVYFLKSSFRGTELNNILSVKVLLQFMCRLSLKGEIAKKNVIEIHVVAKAIISWPFKVV